MSHTLQAKLQLQYLNAWVLRNVEHCKATTHRPQTGIKLMHCKSNNNQSNRVYHYKVLGHLGKGNPPH